MEVNLTKEQKEYVDAYNNILNKLSGIQERIDGLKVEANEALEELNALRSRERDAFPEQLD
jgi:archaellum component FlaC